VFTPPFLAHNLTAKISCLKTGLIRPNEFNYSELNTPFIFSDLPVGLKRPNTRSKSQLEKRGWNSGGAMDVLGREAGIYSELKFTQFKLPNTIRHNFFPQNLFEAKGNWRQNWGREKPSRKKPAPIDDWPHVKVKT
jgi:hypothetical protein